MSEKTVKEDVGILEYIAVLFFIFFTYFMGGREVVKEFSEGWCKVFDVTFAIIIVVGVFGAGFLTVKNWDNIQESRTTENFEVEGKIVEIDVRSFGAYTEVEFDTGEVLTFDGHGYDFKVGENLKIIYQNRGSRYLKVLKVKSF